MEEEELEELIVRNDKTLKPLDRVIAASMGGFITAFAMTPFDVVKARLQAQVIRRGEILHPEQFKGAMDACLKIAKHEGITTLWRGLPPTLVMNIPSTALYFTSYEILKEQIERRSGISTVVSPLMAGLGARVLAATIVAPIELIRTNLQATSAKTNPMNEGIIRTWKNLISSRGGWRSMWSGLPPTLLRDAPFSAIYWFCYELIKRNILQRYDGDRRFFVDFLSGAGAGGFAAIVTTPFDVIKTRRQMYLDLEADSSKHPRKTLEIAKLILREEGFKGLMKGITPRIVKVAPACAIMISSYQLSKRYLNTI